MAATVAAHTSPPGVLPADQPTGSTVAAIHEAVASVAKHYGHRLHSTSAKLTAANAAYTATDSEGGAGINAVQA